VWLLSNQHHHGTNPFDVTLYKHLHFLAQIQELYDAAPNMMAHARAIFEFPFESCKLQSTVILSVFYSHGKDIVETSLKDAAQLGSRFLRINSYLRPTIPAALFDVILGR
jgi:hypothetical protein